MKSKLLVINGPNLNRLGKRDNSLYGSLSLKDIEAGLHESFPLTELTFFQSNHEGALIDRIQAAAEDGTRGIVINPGAYGHTSIALRDAFLDVGLPFIEVHISNVYKREEFRRKSLLSDIASGVIIGLGPAGYETAVTALNRLLRQQDN